MGRFFLIGVLLFLLSAVLSDYSLGRLHFEYAGEWGRPRSLHPHAEGELCAPTDVAITQDGTVYVTDLGKRSLLSFSPRGSFKREFITNGRAPGYPKGGFPLSPCYVEAEAGGEVLADEGTGMAFLRFSRSGDFIGAFPLPPSEGLGPGAFGFTKDITRTRSGEIYLIYMRSPSVLRFSKSGSFLGKRGPIVTCDPDDYYYKYAYYKPRITASPAGTIYITDFLGYRICGFSEDGRFQIAWGGHGLKDGEFIIPADVCVGPEGKVFVVDAVRDDVQYFTSNGSYLGKWGESGSGPGQFDDPSGIGVAPNGWVYVVDRGNQRVQYFKPVFERVEK
jgi:tripartite motif-containing protein 71